MPEGEPLGGKSDFWVWNYLKWLFFFLKFYHFLPGLSNAASAPLESRAQAPGAFVAISGRNRA
jgi:hypothetical protein